MCLAFGIFCIGLYSEGTAAVTGRHSGWVSQSQDFVPSCKSTKPIPSLREMSAEYGNSWIWNSTGRAFKRHYNFGELVVGAGCWLKDFKRILFHILYKKKLKWLPGLLGLGLLPFSHAVGFSTKHGNYPRVQYSLQVACHQLKDNRRIIQ